jgi:hypothetical protein
MLSGPPLTSSVAADQLLERFLSGSSRQRRSLLPTLEARAAELLPLIPSRVARCPATGEDWACGTLLQLMHRTGGQAAAAVLRERWPDGWLEAPSAVGLAYGPLQDRLLEEAFEEADRLTSLHLRQLAGAAAERRGYVYYTEVAGMPGVDLVSLDRLWLVYSRGRYGFSVQGRLLRACAGRWEQLWPRLGWKRDGVWTRYPGSFTWSQDAPEGHMPLVNQLRGVRLMDALLNHPDLARRIEAGAAP